MAGKLQQYENTPGIAAYQLMIIEDVRTSKICRNLVRQNGNGIILPVNHQFWQTYGFPPYHFNCRTSIRPIYGAMIGTPGNNVDNPSMNSFRKSKFKPQTGFGGNPLDSGNWWDLTENQRRLAKDFGIFELIKEERKMLFFSEKAKEILSKQKPVNKEVLNRIKEAFKKIGYSIEQNEEIDAYLERTGREATILSSGDIMMHSNVSAYGLFEELIHWGQIRKYGTNISRIQNCLCEIEAKEKLLKNAKAYGITEYEIEVTKESLLFYKKQLEILKGGSNV
ncbi:MAG: hypothetical protein MJ196_11980 [Treponemataceae bacterium]|nr:hypothetical protein [Treponemataceae bacterium]